LLTEWLGGEHISTLARYIAVTMTLVEREFGKRWDEDAYTCFAANAAVAETWKKIVQLTLEKLPTIHNEKDARRQGQWIGKAFADSFEQRHPWSASQMAEVAKAYAEGYARGQIEGATGNLKGRSTKERAQQ
jgi:hypothetical protein